MTVETDATVTTAATGTTDLTNVAKDPTLQRTQPTQLPLYHHRQSKLIIINIDRVDHHQPIKILQQQPNPLYLYIKQVAVHSHTHHPLSHPKRNLIQLQIQRSQSEMYIC
jgi:hypothetical protein